MFASLDKDRVRACYVLHITLDVHTGAATGVTLDGYVVDELRSFIILHSCEFLFVADSYFASIGDNRSINSGHVLVAPISEKAVCAKNLAFFDVSWFV